MHVEFCRCTEVLLQEIRDTHFSQKHVALTYAMAIASSETKDWKAINDAIIKRWSFSGLKRIKQMAWKKFSG